MIEESDYASWKWQVGQGMPNLPNKELAVNSIDKELMVESDH